MGGGNSRSGDRSDKGGGEKSDIGGGENPSIGGGEYILYLGSVSTKLINYQYTTEITKLYQI